MRKFKLLLFTALFLPAMIFAQGQITSVEYLAQHPELFTQAENNPPVQHNETGGAGQTQLNGATYIYVGFFDGLDGPDWNTNPPCYTGQEAAALLFGGVPGDYVISTNPSTTDPNTITFSAWMVTWGIIGWAEYPQNYKLDIGAIGYNDPGGNGTATSAYVWDNPPPPGSTINYVWRVDATDVPVSNWALFIGIGLIIAFAVIRFRKVL